MIYCIVDRQVSELYTGFPWASLGNGKVVDIGGGNGHISIGLARVRKTIPIFLPYPQYTKHIQLFPSLHFIVQDISPHMLPALQTEQQDISSRVIFLTHDFFTPQPGYSASAPIVFLLRQFLHNYNDSDAIKILRQVVPALERCSRGTPLLINDVVLPDSGEVATFEEHYLRQIDLCIMVTLGAKQRSEGEWNRLIKEADERLEVVKVLG